MEVPLRATSCPSPTPQLRAAQLRAPSAHRVPVFIEKRPRPSCPQVLGQYPQVRITDDLRQQRQEAVHSRQMVQATRLSHVPLTSAPPLGEGKGPGRLHLSHGRATRLKVNTEPRGRQTTSAKSHSCPALPRAYLFSFPHNTYCSLKYWTLPCLSGSQSTLPPGLAPPLILLLAEPPGPRTGLAPRRCLANICGRNAQAPGCTPSTRAPARCPVRCPARCGRGRWALPGR